jgi:hypothetical protein
MDIIIDNLKLSIIVLAFVMLDITINNKKYIFILKIIIFFNLSLSLFNI